MFIQMTFRVMICWYAYLRRQFLNSFMGPLCSYNWRMNSKYVLWESEIFRIVDGGIVLFSFTKASP